MKKKNKDNYMTRDEVIDWLVENMRCDGCPLYEECYAYRKVSCKTMLTKYFKSQMKPS